MSSSSPGKPNPPSFEDAKKELLQRASKAEAELEQFVTLASHNLREPLREIRSRAQIITEDHISELGPAVVQHLVALENASGRMQNLLEGMVSYARLGTRKLHLRPLDFQLVIRQAMLEMQPQISASAAQIRFAEFPQVLGDWDVLAPAVRHLLDNSIKFRSARTPEIDFFSEPGPPGYLTIAVKDNAIGVEQAYWEKCFGLFKRLHGTSEYPGEGLGLSWCRRALELQGGRIWMESEPGSGTVVRFTLLLASNQE